MIERVRAWPDLYFLWWQCVRGFASRNGQSVRFLENFASDTGAAGALRGLLAGGLHDPEISRLPDREVLAEVARRIGSGELLAIRERTPWRDAILGFDAAPNVFLLWRHPASDFRDRRRALDFLSAFSRDKLALAAFRRLLARDLLNRGLDRAGDRQVVEEIARRLVSGDLLVGWEPLPWGAFAAEEEWRAAPLHEPVVVPRVQRSWPVSAAPPVESPTYDPGHDPAAQAATLVAAAQSGAAWCEICAETGAATAARE